MVAITMKIRSGTFIVSATDVEVNIVIVMKMKAFFIVRR